MKDILHEFPSTIMIEVRNSICVIRQSSVNVLGGIWKRISLPDIRDMSSLGGHRFTEPLNYLWKRTDARASADIIYLIFAYCSYAAHSWKLKL